MWNFYQPVKVVFDENSSKLVGNYISELGAKNAVIICDPFLDKCGVAAGIRECAEGKISGIISDVDPNPTIANITNCAAFAKEHGADCIIAIGGGSSMDCAKSVAVCLENNVTAMDLLGGFPITKALPIIAIPTTAGTGSEVTAGAVISNPETHEKLAIFGPAIFPKIALVDPTLTYTVPAKVTASSGIDVLSHATDALCSVKANPATDALAMQAIELVLGNLQAVYEDGSNKEARANMSQASVIAGLAFSQTGTTGSHACSYMLTATYGVPHGEACAFTMDSWLKINAVARPSLHDKAKKLGFADANAFADRISELKLAIGLRTKLAEIGVAEDGIVALAENAMTSSNMTNNIAKVTAEEVAALYREKL